MVTLELQKKGCTLSDFRWVLDELIQAVTVGKVTMSPLSTQCKLGKHYIDPNAAIVKDPEFESGVTKIQRGGVSEEEKRSAKNYKWLNANSSVNTVTNEMRFEF